MTGLLRMTLCLTTGCCALFASRVEAQAAADSSVRRTTLDNGLQVIVAEDHGVPLATVLVAVRTGAMTQDSGDQGAAHLYEHLLFRSYKSDPEAFETEAGDMDAAENGTTATEVVQYYLELPSQNVLKGIALLGRLVQQARFDPRDLKSERPIVLNELQREESDPELALERQASRLLWRESWARKDAGGDSATLRGITSTHLQETFARYYVPNNAALVVTGDVHTADVFTAAKDKFGSWTRAPDPFVAHPIPAVAPLITSAALLMERAVTRVTILVKLRGPSVGPDSIAPYSISLLCDVLNEPTSAFQLRLSGTGLFQSVACNYEPLAHVGPITFLGETTPERASSALTALLQELNVLNSLEGVTSEDLVVAKKRQQVNREISVESSFALAPDLALWWSIGGTEAYQTYTQRITEQRLSDLREVATRFVSGQPRVIAVLTPTETVSDLLIALRPSAAEIERVP